MRVLSFLILLHDSIGVHAWCSSMTTTTRKTRFLESSKHPDLRIQKKDTTTTTTALSLVRFSLSRHHSSSTEKIRGALVISPHALCMGLLDSFFSSSFLQNRQGDFVQLDKSTTAKAFGPGPLLILYNVPTGIQVQEVLDMIHDGAPSAHAQGCTVVRLDDDSDSTDDEDEDGEGGGPE